MGIFHIKLWLNQLETLVIPINHIQTVLFEHIHKGYHYLGELVRFDHLEYQKILEIVINVIGTGLWVYVKSYIVHGKKYI